MKDRIIEIDTAIVGAGFGGMAAAVELLKKRRESFVIFEKAEEVGGTWRENIYPGCACDVPSALYSYSFAPRPDWSQSFAAQPEILEYLIDCSNKFGLRKYIRFNTSVASCRFDESTARWAVLTEEGQEYRARVIILATGPLNRPLVPEIKGIKSFKGEAFHSARWDASCDLKGKKVAVIGTGASAIQVVPNIVDQVESLTLFQRSAPWIMPRLNRKFNRFEKFLFRYVPFIQKLYRLTVYLRNETVGGKAVLGNSLLSPRIHKFVSKLGGWHIRKGIKDKELRKKVTPDYIAGCKRILLSDDYYPALDRANVDLVTSGVAEIKGNSVIAENGEAAEADVIIYCTGFYVSDMYKQFGIEIRGPGGRDPLQQWEASGMEAHYGSVTSGFPNLFFILGPNTGLGHNSMVHIMESQTTYLSHYLKLLEESGPEAFLNVKPEAQALYNAGLQEKMQKTVWVGGACNSWYLDERGKNTVLFPGSTMEFRKLTGHLNPNDFEVLRAPIQTPVPKKTAPLAR